MDYATITGDYPALMEIKLMAGEPLDILYGNPQTLSRYFAGGWILPAEDLPNIDAIKADMYPNIRDALSYKGKLIGLSYFTTTSRMVAVNLKAYNALGYTEDDYPATWDELYDQLCEIREKGVEHAFLPMWYSLFDGTNYTFISEVENRGGHVAHPETHEPMLTVDGQGGDTLRDWKRIYNDGLVPKECVGYSYPELLDSWASGKYIFGVMQAYDLEHYNDPEYSTFAGYCDFIPYQGQPWGMVYAAAYLMTNRERSPEHTDDVMRAFSWYGWKDHEGETFVGQRWMNESMLFSAYKSVMEHPDTKAIISDSISNPDKADALIELYRHTPYPKGTFNVVWSAELMVWLLETLEKFLIDDLPVDETIEAINTKINELNAEYGISG